MFNEYVEYHLLKIRQEKVENSAKTAWMYQSPEKDSFLQRVVKKLTINQPKKVTCQPTCCAC